MGILLKQLPILRNNGGRHPAMPLVRPKPPCQSRPFCGDVRTVYLFEAALVGSRQMGRRALEDVHVPTPSTSPRRDFRPTNYRRRMFAPDEHTGPER
jgi:hypothetical protein